MKAWYASNTLKRVDETQFVVSWIGDDRVRLRLSNHYPLQGVLEERTTSKGSYCKTRQEAVDWLHSKLLAGIKTSENSLHTKRTKLKQFKKEYISC